MIHTLRLIKVHQPVDLTFDREGLRIDGDTNAKKKLKAGRGCCCIPLPVPEQQDPTLLPIPLLNILSVFYNERTTMVQIHALIPREQDKDTPLDLYKFMYTVPEDKEKEATQFCDVVMKQVYSDVPRAKRIKVLINPFSGQGKAKNIYESILPILESAQCRLDVQYTEFQGHAIKIAKDLDTSAFDCIVAVSGDGIPHEIINGFMQRPDAIKAMSQVPLGLIPGGTGNALSVCLLGPTGGMDPALATLQIIKGKNMKLDLCSVTFADHRYFSFLSHNYGMTAYADLGTENLRWMGDARTVVGLIKGIFGKYKYPVEIAMQIVESNKDKIKANYTSQLNTTVPPLISDSTQDTLALSDPVPQEWTVINESVSFFLSSKAPWLARDMLSHPYALPNDGLLDVLLLRGNTSVRQQLGMFNKVEKGQHVHSDVIEYYKVKAFRLTPLVGPEQDKTSFLAMDGEHAPVKPFQVEVHAGLAHVLSLNGCYVTTTH
ncbi:ATP-NAD kinase-like domain-containing protein [Spinellus fusiger]|nr:ATP-NAD kinase-like domain-containing protein [Spinellus fusiger]